jgi:hypothetical protein
MSYITLFSYLRKLSLFVFIIFSEQEAKSSKLTEEGYAGDLVFQGYYLRMKVGASGR